MGAGHARSGVVLGESAMLCGERLRCVEKRLILQLRMQGEKSPSRRNVVFRHLADATADTCAQQPLYEAGKVRPRECQGRREQAFQNDSLAEGPATERPCHAALGDTGDQLLRLVLQRQVSPPEGISI